MDNIVLGGRYSLIEKVSEGGMSTIYKAYCNVLNRIVAVKILKQEFSNDEEFLKKFNNEAKSAASLNHHNIIGIYDVGSDDDVSYIVMEFVDGKNIKQLIKENGKFSETCALDIIRQICLALNEAHSHGIVHRDIKPHNIMINKSGTVKVGDFGIAKATTSATITTSDNIMGSVHYISPEQAKGSYVDKRSDIYSLGIVFYEMITGTVPFNADKPLDVALKHVNEEVNIPDEHKSTISTSVQNIILKMTQKNPVKRYENVSEIIRDIIKIHNNIGQVSYFADDEDTATKVIKIPKEEKNEKKVDKKEKKKKRKLILPLITLILLLLCAFFVYTSEFFNSFTGRHNVVIPNIEGMTLEQATSELEKNNLKLKILSEKEDFEHEAGIVLEQNPDAKIEIRKGEEISVVVSKTPSNLVIVPNVIGKYLDDAKNILEGEELKVNIKYVFSVDIEKNKVISQSIKENEKAKHDDEITLTVSKGEESKKEVTPNLVGLTVDSASSKIGNFAIGSISYKEDSSKTDGIILYQNPSANSTQEPTKIDIVVNKLPEKKQEETSNSNNSENISSNQNTQTPSSNREVITQDMTLVMPKTENVLLTLKDKTSGSTVVSSNITTSEGENIIIKVKGYSGQTKQYDIYLGGEYYATTGNVTF